MNTRLLFLLFLLAAGFYNATGQAGLSTLAVEKLAPLSENLQRLPFTLSKLKAGAAPDMLLDSTVNFTGYTNYDSLRHEKSAFEYLLPNTRVETRYTFDGSWQPVARITVASDDLGRLILALEETRDPGSEGWLPVSQMHVYPHGDSKTEIDSMNLESWDAGAGKWIINFSLANVYDAQDRLVSTTTMLVLDDLGTFTLLDVLEYDENGDNTLTRQYVLEQGMPLPFGYVERTFDQHREIESIAWVYYEDGFELPQSKITSAYDNHGNLTQTSEFTYDTETGGWFETFHADYFYDDSGRLISEILRNNGLEPQKTRIDYSYVYSSYLDRQIHYDWNENDQVWILSDKTYFYYNGSTAVSDQIFVEKLAVYPNPTAGIVRMADLDGQALVEVAGLDGQSVQTMIVSGQNQSEIDLSGLPAGLYMVKARGEKSVRVALIVKL